MEDGELTSVQLTRAYIARIAALNKRGPGLNAVTQLNQDALKDAAQLDNERADRPHPRPAARPAGPAQGPDRRQGACTRRPATRAGELDPATDSGVAKTARARRGDPRQARPDRVRQLMLQRTAVRLRNLGGQVLNAFDADQNPSGSSSGSGAAGAAGLSMLTIGTETSGSIISPSARRASSACGRRSGSSPATASRRSRPPGHGRPDGPHGRRRGAELQSIAGPDPAATRRPTSAPATVPDYLCRR